MKWLGWAPTAPGSQSSTMRRPSSRTSECPLPSCSTPLSPPCACIKTQYLPCCGVFLRDPHHQAVTPPLAHSERGPPDRVGSSSVPRVKGATGRCRGPRPPGRVKTQSDTLGSAPARGMMLAVHSAFLGSRFLDYKGGGLFLPSSLAPVQ